MFSKSMYELGAQPSPIRKLFNYGQIQAKKLGPDHVFDFTLGSPSVPMPSKVAQCWEELNREIDPVALHTYTVSAGRPEARQAIADDLNERYHTHYGPGDLYLSCGAAASLCAVFKALTLNHQSKILAMAPFFPEYRNFVESKGGKFDYVPAAADFRVNLEALKQAVDESTQGVIINSPNNPGGKIYTREELKALASLLEEKSRQFGHPIYLISDEPYRELAYDGLEVPWIPSIYRNSIVCYSWSKSFSIPGERIGYTLVPPEAEDAKKIYLAISGAARTMGYVCAPALAQRVIETCIKERPDLQPYEENRQLLYGSLSEMGYSCVHPDGAFYLFVKAPNGDGSVFSEMAMEKNVLIVPGDGFGCPDYVRISYCIPNDRIRRALPLFKDLLAQACGR